MAQLSVDRPFIILNGKDISNWFHVEPMQMSSDGDPIHPPHYKLFAAYPGAELTELTYTLRPPQGQWQLWARRFFFTGNTRKVKRAAARLRSRRSRQARCK